MSSGSDISASARKRESPACCVIGVAEVQPERASADSVAGVTCPTQSPYPAWVSAGDVRSGAGQIEADEDPLLPLHRPAVVVPVGMLPGDLAVVVDQRLHRLGQRQNARGSLDLDEAAVERVREDAQPGPWVAPHVLRLDRCLATRDDD